MKKRVGFVSNSSSSSFVLKPEDLELASKKGIKIYEIKEILKLFENINLINVPSEEECDKIMPWQMYNKELEHYATDPFDYIKQGLRDYIEEGFTHVTDEYEYGYGDWKTYE